MFPIRDILKEFKPIVGKLVDKRSEAPNFDRQLLTDEIETGLINEKTGKQTILKEYNRGHYVSGPDMEIYALNKISKFKTKRRFFYTK